MRKSKIICTVSNDLIQDNRMFRICNTLTDLSYEVILVGRKRKKSLPFGHHRFSFERILCYFERGFLFYLEYNLRLTYFLFGNIDKNDIIYTVDTDTLLAGGVVKWVKRCHQIFDAHEYFTKVPELIHKPLVRKVWSVIEKIFIPKADVHITVSQSLAKLFSGKYGVSFTELYNVPNLVEIKEKSLPKSVSVIIYIGMLNAGRGLEQIIWAMNDITDAELWIVGHGDIAEELQQIAESSEASQRIIFKGWKSAAETQTLLQQATVGINLLDGSSESYYYSLANKFFDYMHAELPSVNMNFPEYQSITERFEVGILLEDLNSEKMAVTVNSLLRDKVKLEHLKSECRKAKQFFNWEHEARKLSELVMIDNKEDF